jgi:hypothetical protein
LKKYLNINKSAKQRVRGICIDAVYASMGTNSINKWYVVV